MLKFVIFSLSIWSLTNLIQGQMISFGSQPVKDPFACTAAAGGRGSCTLESECPFPGHQPKVCGLRLHLRVICCPNDDPTVRLGRISAPVSSFECGVGAVPNDPDLFLSRKRRAEIGRSNTSFPFKGLGDFKIHVVGGVESRPNSWPWMALLGSKAKSEINWFCDGSLINERWILTAAHCLTNSLEILARLGEHDLNKRFNFNRKDYNVISKFISPLYNIDGGYHDVGLVNLHMNVKLGSKVGPVCLPWGEKAKRDIRNQKVILTGWGTEQFGGRSSQVLREAKVTIFDPNVCQQSYSKLLSFERQFPQKMTRKNTICAGHPEGGIDACQGDSGGPIVLKEEPAVFGGPEVFTIVGIVSRGHGCGLEDFPGLYAPVASYLEWIKDIAFSNKN